MVEDTLAEVDTADPVAAEEEDTLVAEATQTGTKAHNTVAAMMAIQPVVMKGMILGLLPQPSHKHSSLLSHPYLFHSDVFWRHTDNQTVAATVTPEAEDTVAARAATVVAKVATVEARAATAWAPSARA